MTDLEVFTLVGLGGAKAETRFTFGNKVDASMSSGGVLDDARLDRGDSQ